MRCIEYLELLGYGAVMEGAEENRTCIDVLLKGIDRYSSKHKKTIEVTVKPSMYYGKNHKIREFLDTFRISKGNNTTTFLRTKP